MCEPAFVVAHLAAFFRNAREPSTRSFHPKASSFRHFSASTVVMTCNIVEGDQTETGHLIGFSLASRLRQCLAEPSLSHVAHECLLPFVVLWLGVHCWSSLDDTLSSNVGSSCWKLDDWKTSLPFLSCRRL